MRILTLLVAILALFIGCAKQLGTDAKTQNRLKIQDSQLDGEYHEKLNICEAVFRYQFEHNASTVQQNAKAYFIMIFNKDPSDEFLARFKGNTPSVRKVSDFVVGRGLIFSIKSITRIDERTVQVSGGYFEAGLSSSGNTYTVVNKNGKWVVENDEMQWISQYSARPEMVNLT
jgi:hypothetical protein